MIKFVAVALMFLVPTLGSAGVITTNTAQGVEYIEYSGRVDVGDADRLEQFFKDNPDIEWVSFNSGGGDAQTGRDISNLMADYVMSSVVFEGNRCMSSCAMAFIGGERLSINGHIGFHSWLFTDYEGPGRIRVEKDEITELVYYAQLDTTLDTYVIMKNGFSWDLHYDYANKLGDFLTMHNNADLEKYYIGEMFISKEYIDGLSKQFVSFGIEAKEKMNEDQH